MLELARFRTSLALLTAAAAAMGCGDDESVVGGGGSTSESVSSSATTGGAGGEGGEGGSGGEFVCTPSDEVVLALTTLYFGHGDSGEWKSVGLNIDGLVSDGNSTDVCQTSSGGDPEDAYPDGDDGIDNSFGKNLLPIILGLVPTWPAGVQSYLDDGDFNAMLKMYCLPPTGDAEFITKVFGGTSLGSTPQYDGTDVWPVTPEILGDPLDPESSTLVFENSSITGDTFDSGSQETFVLTLPIEINNEITLLKLTLYGAHVIMTMSEDRKSATGGVIAGVLNTEEFIDQVKKIGFILDVCNEPQYEAIVDYARRSSDIMTDGTQDTTATCDGISFGVAFTMEEVQLGGVGPVTPVAMACP